MKVSIIIPSYNGKHRLNNILKSIENQTLRPFEVILVIDGSTDGTRLYLENIKFDILNFRIIYQTNGGRAQVRNNGAHIAEGDILLFADDDIILPNDWVEQHVQHHLIHKGTILTGKLCAPNNQLSTDFFNFKIWLNDKWSNKIESRFEDCFELDYPYITACNFSIPKALFFNLGGFDSRLRDAEDYDLAVRAQFAGISIFFSNKAVAINNDVDNITCINYIKRIREYTFMQQYLQKLKPELYSQNHRYASVAPKGIKGKIFLFFCSKFWINAIENKWLLFLPKNSRYKLYDLVITANASFFPHKVNL